MQKSRISGCSSWRRAARWHDRRIYWICGSIKSTGRTTASVWIRQYTVDEIAALADVKIEMRRTTLWPVPVNESKNASRKKNTSSATTTSPASTATKDGTSPTTTNQPSNADWYNL